MIDKIKFVKYLFSNLFSKGIVLIIVTLISSAITLEDFAVFNLYYLIISLVSPILFISIWEGLFRELRANNGKNSKIILSINSLFVIYFLFLVILFFFSYIVFFNSSKYFLLSIFMFITHTLFIYFQYLVRGYELSNAYAASLFISAISNLLLLLFFVFYKGYGIEALFLSQIGSYAVAILFMLNITWKKLAFSNLRNISSISEIMPIAKYSFPLSINSSGWWMLTQGPLYSLMFAGVSLQQIGIYSILLRFGGLISLISVNFNMVWQEKRFSLYSKEDQNFTNGFNKVMTVSMCSIFGASLLGIFYYEFAVFGEYKSGNYLLPISLATYSFLMINFFLGTELLANRKSTVVTYSSIMGGLFAMIATFLLADFIGIVSAGFASALGTALCVYLRINNMKIGHILNIWISNNLLLCFLFIAYIAGITLTEISGKTITISIILTIWSIYYIFDIKKFFKTYFKQ